MHMILGNIKILTDLGVIIGEFIWLANRFFMQLIMKVKRIKLYEEGNFNLYSK